VRIAQATGLSRATVSRILVRLKLNKVKMLEPQVPVVRYEHAAPGDLLHIDIKKLARIHKPGHRITGNPQDETRGAGWEFLYVAVDDHSRMAYVAMMPDEKAISASSFLSQAHAYFARHNIHLRRVMTDNGPCFISDLFRDTCKALHLRHVRTRIYTPRTNGKAERFIQTAIREWAYARLYQNSAVRNSHLEPWIHQYNWHRPHASLEQKPPISRSGLDVNNLLRHHI
jgi:transposase InsO family protein